MSFQSLMAKKLGGKFSMPPVVEEDTQERVSEWLENNPPRLVEKGNASEDSDTSLHSNKSRNKLVSRLGALKSKAEKGLKALNRGEKMVIQAKKKQESKRKSQIETEWFNCKTCDFKATSKTELSLHKKLSHKSIENYSCHECTFKSTTKESLKAHVTEDHRKEYSCTDCEYKSYSEEDIVEHKGVSHDKTFTCPICDYHSVTKPDLNSHISLEHKEGGVIQNTAGFLMLQREESDIDLGENNDKTSVVNDHRDQGAKVKRKTHKEFMKSEVKVKTIGKKKMIESFKEKYLTLKKKVSSHQREHGVEEDYLLLIKNNLQDPNAVNAGTTAGKYLVVSEGPARELFLTEGLRFEKGVTYMMANTWDMSEEKVIEEDKSDLEDDEELAFE